MQILCFLVVSADMILHRYNILNSGVDIVSDACMSIEALFLLVNTAQDGGGESNLVNRVLRDCLKSLIMLCKVRSDACDQFVDIVGGLLHFTSGTETKMLICQVGDASNAGFLFGRFFSPGEWNFILMLV